MSRTAWAAACATGLPTYVPPMAESPGASMISALPITPESGSPAAIDFATRHQVGLDAVVLDREHLPGAAEAGLDLVHDEDDPVLVADPAHSAHELLRRDDEAALALDGSTTIAATCSGATCVRNARSSAASASRGQAAVVLRERHAVDLGREWAEPALYGCVFEVSVMDSSVRPWKPPSNAISAGRPVYARANLIEFSTASVPALKNAAFAGWRTARPRSSSASAT